MEHIAIYREYRPKNFDEVIGQDHIVKTLKNQIKHSSISHAYLFCGTRGTGKTSTAKIFAKAINCENNSNGSPCYECSVCKNLEQNASLDILEIDAASNNRVDEIRDLREKIKYPPVNCKYKVYIIDEVHMLTDSAYNALLKTLEEPPKHAVFILCTTEVHKLPQTILSRCMRFDFHLVKIEELVIQLKKIFNEKNIKFEEEALHLIASKGEGSVRDTLSIADLCASFSNNNITYKSVLEALGSSSLDVLTEITYSLINSDGEKLLIAINNLSNSGKNFTIFGKELVNHFKTLLTIKSVKNPQEFLKLPDDIFAVLNSQAILLTSERLLNAMTKLSSIETQLKFSINPRTLIEITLLSLLELEKKTEFVEKKTEFVDNQEKTEVFQNKIVKEFTKESNNHNTENNKTKAIDESNFSKLEKIEEKLDDDVFKNEQKSVGTEQIYISKIMKNLRENRLHLLQSVFQNLLEAKIVENKLEIHFSGKNFQEILEKQEHINLINDIIKDDNLLISFIFDSEKTEKNIVDRLKEKFNKIDIKE